MKVYTYSDARRQLAALLDEAYKGGEVRIKRRDGSVFSLRPVQSDRSPLDVPGIDTDVTAQEIVAAIREGRERSTS